MDQLKQNAGETVQNVREAANRSLIFTLDEVIKLQDEGRREAEPGQMENALKQKLPELRKP